MDRPSRKDRIDLENRRILLDKVQQFWIDGVLVASLHGNQQIEVSLEVKADASARPQAGSAGLTERQVLSTQIDDIFEAMGRSLQILGAPGSGKTTVMLELCKHRIERVRKNPDEPLPVVFSLSTWDGKLGVTDWLVEELNNKYGVPKRVGRHWISRQNLLLLLDGLDEVKSEKRDICVDALGVFLVEHQQTSLAITSSVDDYEALADRLLIGNRVLLQPLTDEQIGTYLARGGERLASLQSQLQEVPVLREMARLPLMLSVVAESHEDAGITQVVARNTVKERYRYLLDTYLRHKLQSPSRKLHLSSYQMTGYLRALAQYMAQDGSSIFLVEQLQPSHLRHPQRRQYNILQRIVIIPLWVVGTIALAAISFLLFAMFAYAFIADYGFMPYKWLDSIPAPLSCLGSSAIIGIVVGVIFGQGARQRIKRPEVLGWSLGWSWRAALQGLAIGFFAALGLLLFNYRFSYPSGNYPAYSTHMGLYHLGLGFGASSDWGLLLGYLMTCFGLTFGCLRRSRIVPQTAPNQAIQQSFRNALAAGGIFNLIAILVGLLSSALTVVPDFSSLTVDLLITGGVLGFIVGVPLASAAWFFAGGRTFIQHRILRTVLHRGSILPFRLVDFLDDAADLGILHKVGGGYIFMHQALWEHLGGVEPAMGSVPSLARRLSVFVPIREWLTKTVYRGLNRLVTTTGVILATLLLVLSLATVLSPGLFVMPEQQSPGHLSSVVLGGTRGVGGFVYEVIWSEDSQYIATAVCPLNFLSPDFPIDITTMGLAYNYCHGEPVTASVWNASTGEWIGKPDSQQFQFVGSKSWLSSRTYQPWSPNGKYWAVNTGWQILIRDLVTRTYAMTAAQNTYPHLRPHWLSNSDLVTLYGGPIVWDPATGEQIRIDGVKFDASLLEKERRQTGWSVDGTMLVMGFVDANKNTVVSWDVETGDQINAVVVEAYRDSVSLSDSRSLFAYLDVQDNTSIMVRETRTGNLVSRISTGGVHLEEAPHWGYGDRVLIPQENSYVFCDGWTGKCLPPIEDHPLGAMELSPNGEIVALRTSNSELILRHIASNLAIGSLNVPGGQIRMRWSPDGSKLAVTNGTPIVTIIDIQDGAN